jgi:hypothetical protein
MSKLMFAANLNSSPISAECVLTGENSLPDEPGVYMIFVHGGLRLLQATSYFDTDTHVPPFYGDCALMYVGAAVASLRNRVKAHFCPDAARSSLRLTLLAMEHARHAISRSRTPFCRIMGASSLTDWLVANSLILPIPCTDPLKRERRLIEELGPPLNINWRPQHVYSRLLIEWREAVVKRRLCEKRSYLSHSDMEALSRLMGELLH